jgi:hypothetical protein
VKHLLLALIVAVAFVGAPSRASALPIVWYDITELGGDVWQYDYFLEFAPGDSLDALQGFAVSFDRFRYTDLQLVGASPAEWDPLVLQPDLVLDSNGLYDALAISDSPLFDGPFSVSFTWLDSPLAPGSQAFYTYALNASDTPEPLEFGETRRRASVPEPSTLLLITAAAAAAALRRGRRQSGERPTGAR